jgi:hypothetical protein
MPNWNGTNVYLYLNSTETDLCNKPATEPTEFCHAFLLKTTVYRAREAQQQSLKANKEIVYIPSTAFATRL